MCGALLLGFCSTSGCADRHSTAGRPAVSPPGRVQPGTWNYTFVTWCPCTRLLVGKVGQALVCAFTSSSHSLSADCSMFMAWFVDHIEQPAAHLL